jgi:hypothetical protein
MQMAIDDAVEKLHRRLSSTGEVAEDDAISAAAIRRQLLNNRFIADRFVQRFRRPGGDVYRAALLLNPDSRALEQANAAIVTAERLQRQTWLGMVASFAALVASICLLYAFLNFATRGYYAWALRLVMVVVLAVGVWMVAQLFGMGPIL